MTDISKMSFVRNKNINFIKNEFSNYYKQNLILDVPQIQTREFGIGTYGKKISNRHLSFKSHDDLNYYLRTNTPFFISNSTSYFKYPSRRPMDTKGWLGSDLVYEFDSDDFDMPCHDEHNIWYCKTCGLSGIGNKLECSNCNSKTKIIEWTCDKCIGFAKKETIRLINFLESEFKLDPTTFIISFSGSKGFHIRVTDEKIRGLEKSARLQLVNYIQGSNIDLKKLGFKKEKKQWLSPDPKNVKGWSKKILDYIINIINQEDPKILVDKFNIGNKTARNILENKQAILNGLDNKFLWSNFPRYNIFWESILNKAIEENSFQIDPSTSVDIYKITRTPNTIHGGTGFLSKSINIDDLKNFDAFYDPVVLESNKQKKIRTILPVPRFKLLDQFYGPFRKGEILELNYAVSIFLILKGVAI